MKLKFYTIYLLVFFTGINALAQNKLSVGAGLGFATGVSVDYDEHDKYNPGLAVHMHAGFDPTEKIGFETGFIKYLPSTPPSVTLNLYGYYIDGHFTIYNNRIDKFYLITGYYHSFYTYTNSDISYEDYVKDYPGFCGGIGINKLINKRLNFTGKVKFTLSEKPQLILQAGLAYPIK